MHILYKYETYPYCDGPGNNKEEVRIDCLIPQCRDNYPSSEPATAYEVENSGCWKYGDDGKTVTHM